MVPNQLCWQCWTGSSMPRECISGASGLTKFTWRMLSPSHVRLEPLVSAPHAAKRWCPLPLHCQHGHPLCQSTISVPPGG